MKQGPALHAAAAVLAVACGSVPTPPPETAPAETSENLPPSAPKFQPGYRPYQGPPPNFGPNVVVYGPQSKDFSAVSDRYRGLGSAVEGQFSSDRVAFLFLPGEYRVDLPVGYYTTVAGLGRSPEDVRLVGDVRSDAALAGGNALCNFWRAVENFTVAPTVSGRMKWAVAQAAPFRRMKVEGDLNLADSGPTAWSSGGFLANSWVTGTVRSLSQQQWLSRTSRLGGWVGGNWNMAFLGVEGAPQENGWSKQSPVAVKAAAPLAADKPFLFVDTDGWKVFVPAVRKNQVSFVWGLDTADGRSLPIEGFHIAQAGTDTAESLNAALAAGKNLLLTPGIYPLTAPLTVGRPGTVVLGLGFATLTPTGPFEALKIGKAEGVRVAGVLVDAGTEPAPTLVRVQGPGAVLNDLVVRVGNGRPAAADTAVTIDADGVILDHAWLWVADHDAQTSPLPWKTNPSQTGLVVNGGKVSAYGLFVEHFQGYQTLWNGDEGSVYLYQSELPYSPDETWSSAQGVRGYASYKVARSVTTHLGWALGIYQVFGTGSQRAVEAPVSPDVQFERVMTTSIVSGPLNRVINDAGTTVSPGQTAWIEVYP